MIIAFAISGLSVIFGLVGVVPMGPAILVALIVGVPVGLAVGQPKNQDDVRAQHERWTR